jgi:hypothetical protein
MTDTSSLNLQSGSILFSEDGQSLVNTEFRTTDLTDVNISSLIDGKWLRVSGNKIVQADGVEPEAAEDVARNEMNIMLNASRIASGTENMVDGRVNPYKVKNEGIDTGNSSNYLYNASGDYYRPESGSFGELMLKFEGNDGAKEIVDDGNTGHVVTQNGTAQLKPNHYKIGSGACSFDGTDDFIYCADHADWSFGTGDFTIDFWVNFTTMPASNYMFYSQHDSGTDYIQFYLLSSGKLRFISAESSVSKGVYETTTAPTIETGTWYHIAYVRNGANFYIFLDGTSLPLTEITAIGSNSMPDVATEMCIGTNEVASPASFLDGYLDEFRVSKGTARYTSNFTPSTSPFTSDANTKLLLHLDQDFTDSGNTGHTVTSNGAGLTGVFGNAHVWFDGNSDYLTIPDHADFDFGSGDYTIDCWIKAESLPANKSAIWIHSTNGSIYAALYIWNDGHVSYNTAGGADTTIISSAGVIATGTWYHIAVVAEWSSDKCTLYIDGDSVGSDNDISAYNDFTQVFAIGAEHIPTLGTDNYFHGCIDEFRISKGVARWTSSFTAPTSPHTSDANTKLLLHCDSLDLSNSIHIPTFHGNAEIDTAQYKFGSGSILFDGTGDYVSIPDSSDWDILTQANATVDFWVKHTDHAGLEDYICHYEGSTDWWGVFHEDGTGLRFYTRTTAGSTVDSDTGGEITDTDWHHIAVCIVGDTVGVYKDGVQVCWLASLGTSAGVTFTGTLRIGKTDSSQYFSGHMDEIRIVHDNVFGAAPNSGKTDTITVPTSSYSLETENMTLQSDTIPAEGTVNKMRVAVGLEEVDSITINTDFKVEATANGTNWEEITLIDEGDYEEDRKFLSAEHTFTNTGTTPKIRLESLNNKDLKAHFDAVLLKYSG